MGKYRHVYDTHLSKGIESTCKYCEIKVTPLLGLSYFEYVKKEGYYGDTQWERLPECVKKL